MRIEDLPTNDDWSDWEQTFPGGSDYSGTFAAGDLTGARIDDVTAERISEVLAWHAHSPEGYGSVDFWAVVRLTDGQVAVSEAWADTTGWGCQADAWWKTSPTLKGALAELSKENRSAARTALRTPALDPDVYAWAVKEAGGVERVRRGIAFDAFEVGTVLEDGDVRAATRTKAGWRADDVSLLGRDVRRAYLDGKLTKREITGEGATR